MSVLTLSPKEREARLRRLEALERQFDTDIKRLWKRIAASPEPWSYANQTGLQQVDPEDIFQGPLSGMDFSGTLPGSGPSSPFSGSASQTNLNTGMSGGGSGIGRSGGTSLSGTPLSGTQTQGTGITGLTGGTSITGSGTPASGINTGASGGGSGIGVSGGTGLSGTPLSGTPLSGTPFSGACAGPMLIDTFTDTNGLQLAFHPPDYDLYSQGWSGDVNDLRIQSNKLADLDRTVTTLVEKRAHANAHFNNVKLTASGMTSSAIAPAVAYFGYVVRYNSDLDHWILRLNGSSNVLEIIEVNSGTRTVRASSGAAISLSYEWETTAIVRDQYIRFQRGAYWVSYGSASYLQSAVRFGIYTGIQGSTSADVFISDFRMDCLPSDTSGTGLSGSRSESHLSGGGVSGGTVANTGGTINTGGTQMSGTGVGTVFCDPNSDVAYTWSDDAATDYTRVDDGVRSPSTPPGGDFCLADSNDDSEEAVFGMTQPISSGTVVKITLYAYMAPGSSVSVDLRVKLNGTWLAAGNVTVNSSTWYTRTYTGSWDANNQIFPMQIGIKPGAIGKSDQLAVRAAYVRLDFS